MSDNNKSHILRAWRDPDYHDSLSDAERAALPDSPASVLELDDATLAFITGGDGASTCPNTPPPSTPRLVSGRSAGESPAASERRPAMT
ncbi:mersacidin/lichenicidin family type 2 lantibiotic [Myxococcus xanthus]|uniref:mersacidin/lichenicidin family type 2 lantibiotic n=1 Tax=Myxococcus xanthus TaxID=34 RepID=UPI001574F025